MTRLSIACHACYHAIVPSQAVSSHILLLLTIKCQKNFYYLFITFCSLFTDLCFQLPTLVAWSSHLNYTTVHYLCFAQAASHFQICTPGFHKPDDPVHRPNDPVYEPDDFVHKSLLSHLLLTAINASPALQYFIFRNSLAWTDVPGRVSFNMSPSYTFINKHIYMQEHVNTCTHT